MPTDLSQEPQISLFLQFLECKLPACHPAQRRCCCPAAQVERCIHLHATAQKTCACTVPGKEVSQSGQGPCGKENAKRNLKSPLPLGNPSQISTARRHEQQRSPRVSWCMAEGAELPNAEVQEHCETLTTVNTAVPFRAALQAMPAGSQGIVPRLPQANTSVAFEGEEIQQIHTAHEKSCPLELSLLVRLPCPRNQNTREILKTKGKIPVIHIYL